MAKYLMFDHGGVLDGDSTTTPAKDDIILFVNDIDGVKYYNVLPAEVIRLINRLVNEFGYQVVYHSSNVANDQLRVHNALVEGAKQKGLTFPAVVASAAPNRDLKDKTPDNPERSTLGNTDIPFYSYATVLASKGKSCVRAALAAALGIGASREDRQQHVVFDDGRSNVEEAKKEGYRAYLIGDGSFTLVNALKDVIANELILRMAAPATEEKKSMPLEPTAADLVARKKAFIEELKTMVANYTTKEQLLDLFNEMKKKEGNFAYIHSEQTPNWDKFRLFFKISHSDEKKFWHTATYQEGVKILKDAYVALENKGVSVAPARVSEEKTFLEYYRGNSPIHFLAAATSRQRNTK